MNLSSKRVMVTGGEGFLGSYVVAELKRREAAAIFVPGHQDYDLTQLANPAARWIPAGPGKSLGSKPKPIFERGCERRLIGSWPTASSYQPRDCRLTAPHLSVGERIYHGDAKNISTNSRIERMEVAKFV